MSAKEFSILAVDDEEVMRRFLAEALQALEYPFEVASCAKECLEKMAGRSFEAVLLDLVLPDIDGESLMSVLRHQSPQTRIVVISSMDDNEIIQEVLSKGAVAYLVKPVTFEALQQVLQKLEAESTADPTIPKTA